MSANLSTERRAWLPPEEVVRRLELRPGLRVADIGAGSGYLTAPIAEAVGPTGRVAALDLQPEMLERLRHRLAPGAPVDGIQADASFDSLSSVRSGPPEPAITPPTLP